jgi:hypothetical protein
MIKKITRIGETKNTDTCTQEDEHFSNNSSTPSDIKEENKKISIAGTNTRYQLKRVTQNKIEKKRSNIEFSDNLLGNQFRVIEELHESDDYKNINSTSHKLFIKEITNKINGYKRQDILKKLLDPDNFVSLKQIIDKLYESNLSCYYCSEEIYILYEMVREKKQWSLDRINNDLGHNATNVVISCLDCNLKRKCKSKDAFAFTKQFTLVRSEETNK